MTYLCITFDYELFFGENYGTYDEVLFDPTYKLIDTLEEKGVCATFFADVCSIPIAKKYDQYSYVEGFEKQLKYMIEHGQDVQLHLHPHWYYSKCENGNWSFSNKGYRIHEFIKDGMINSIVSDGVNYLNDLLKPIRSEYKCIAYRAGGFSLQPHEELIKILYQNGIRVDSSVAPNLYSDNGSQKYDYRHKLDAVNWFISPERKWWEEGNSRSGLLEIPIAVIDKNPILFTFKRIFAPRSIKLSLGLKRGTYISESGDNRTTLLSLYKYFTGYNAVSLDAYSADYLYSQLKRLGNAINANAALAIIGHPKLSNQVYVSNLGHLIDKIKQDEHYNLTSVVEYYNSYAD